jgi:hypothetical protein
MDLEKTRTASSLSDSDKPQQTPLCIDEGLANASTHMKLKNELM